MKLKDNDLLKTVNTTCHRKPLFKPLFPATEQHKMFKAFTVSLIIKQLLDGLDGGRTTGFLLATLLLRFGTYLREHMLNFTSKAGRLLRYEFCKVQTLCQSALQPQAQYDNKVTG